MQIGHLETSTTRLPCRDSAVDLWFSASPAEVEQAKSLCAQCPIRATCLAGAVDRREFTGVWGGELFDKGVIVPFKRGRGRPRKNAA